MAEKKEEKLKVEPVAKIESKVKPAVKVEPKIEMAPGPDSPEAKALRAKENEKRKAAGKPLLKERVLFVPE